MVVEEPRLREAKMAERGGRVTIDLSAIEQGTFACILATLECVEDCRFLIKQTRQIINRSSAGVPHNLKGGETLISN